MTLTIDLSPELEAALRQHAAQSGLDLDAFVLEAVREKLAKSRTFEEVCAPLARAVEAAGMTEEDLDRVFEEARNARWRERKGLAQ